jgi:hypothetical protein
MPTSRFHHAAALTAPVERAWTALQTAATWAEIGGIDHISDVRHQGADLVGFRFAATAAGRRYPGVAHVVSAIRPDRMTLEIDTSEVTGIITVTLAPNAVTVGLSVSSKGLLAGIAFPAIASAIGSGFSGHVEAFARRLG